jgi:ubiquinone/menaquinone biosynthesis C-methylase UbiE
VLVFDVVAERYDRTRGGEKRGEAYASELDKLLDLREPVLEVGVGTGVVALGLQRRGHRVVGIDLSAAMLRRARHRVGNRVAQGDACCLPIRSGSVRQAVAVWVVHSVETPDQMFFEVARVLSPGGRFLVCPVNRASPDDVAGQAFEAMARRVDDLNRQSERTAASAESFIQAGRRVGLQGRIRALPAQRWRSTRDSEIQAILERSWSALVPLSEADFASVTAETLKALRSLPDGTIWRTATAEVVVLDKPNAQRFP